MEVIFESRTNPPCIRIAVPGKESIHITPQMVSHTQQMRSISRISEKGMKDIKKPEYREDYKSVVLEDDLSSIYHRQSM